ncbi:unnamed protein product [Mytilus edulis]|uniref:Uncharacterized protein n=1 Tax=Mytilus edulis TaxID=6550 RepID=A0A8S3QZV6_MYTED|nr:unnamed protein product [Mytilus edulis]
MQGYMININTCPRVILTCIPGIGDAIAARLMDMRGKGIHIDRDVLFQIPHLRVTEGILGIIDFSRRPRAELREAVCDRACSVSMLTPKPDHVIIDMGPEECPRSILKDRGISYIPEYESSHYYPVQRDGRTEDQKQITHLQDYDSNIRQWLEECEVASSCSEEGACSSLEWDKRRLEQIQRRSEHLTMLEQLHCEPPQESLSSVSLNSDLSVCSNEYRTPPPRINMVAHPQPDSQLDGDVPNDRMFTPLSQNWYIQNTVVDQQEDCNHQQEVQQTPPRYNSPDYDQQPRFLHTPTPDHVHFSPSVQHEHHYVNQYQHGFNSLHRLEVYQSQQPTVHSQIDIHNCPTNQHPGVNKVQRRVQMQQKVQYLQQRLDQLQQGVINYAQPVQQQHLLL